MVCEVWFSADNSVLTAVQAACVALPAAGVPAGLARFSGRSWALVLPLCIAAVVAAIAAVPATAGLLSWIAFLFVPPGSAVALGWAARGARWWLAPVAGGALVLAWSDPGSRAGQLSTIVLVAGSCVTLGRLLAGSTSTAWLKAGIVAMALVDTILVFSGQLQAPNATLVAASPGGGLPQLQSIGFGASSMGYGDLFAAAVLGGVLAVEERPQAGLAAALVLGSLAFDQLFAIFDVLPATVPVAAVLIGAELRRPASAPRSRWSRHLHGDQPAPGT